MRNLVLLLGWLVFVIITVPILFSKIPDRQVAGVIAGVLFILSGLFSVWVAGSKRRLSLIMGGLFLGGFALPIFLLRVLNWNIPFSELSVLGVSGDQLHKFSSWVYLGLMVSIMRDLHTEWVQTKKAA